MANNYGLIKGTFMFSINHLPGLLGFFCFRVRVIDLRDSIINSDLWFADK